MFFYGSHSYATPYADVAPFTSNEPNCNFYSPYGWNYPNTGLLSVFAGNALWINAGSTKNAIGGSEIKCTRSTDLVFTIHNTSPRHRQLYMFHNLYYYGDSALRGQAYYEVEIHLNRVVQGSISRFNLYQGSGQSQTITVPKVYGSRVAAFQVTQSAGNPASSLRPIGFFGVVTQDLVSVRGGGIDAKFNTMTVYGDQMQGIPIDPNLPPPPGGGTEPPPIPGESIPWIPINPPLCIPASLKLLYPPAPISFDTFSSEQFTQGRYITRTFELGIMRDKGDPKATYCEDPIKGKMTFRINSVSNGGRVNANNQDVNLNNGLLFSIEEGKTSVPVTFTRPKDFELSKSDSLISFPYKAIIKKNGNGNLKVGDFEVTATIIIEY